MLSMTQHVAVPHHLIAACTSRWLLANLVRKSYEDLSLGREIHSIFRKRSVVSELLSLVTSFTYRMLCNVSLVSPTLFITCIRSVGYPLC
jgi:hypothetical protein